MYFKLDGWGFAVMASALDELYKPLFVVNNQQRFIVVIGTRYVYFRNLWDQNQTDTDTDGFENAKN